MCSWEEIQGKLTWVVSPNEIFLGRSLKDDGENLNKRCAIMKCHVLCCIWPAVSLPIWCPTLKQMVYSFHISLSATAPILAFGIKMSPFPTLLSSINLFKISHKSLDIDPD
jgi:hypothetical protein